MLVKMVSTRTVGLPPSGSEQHEVLLLGYLGWNTSSSSLNNANIKKQH